MCTEETHLLSFNNIHTSIHSDGIIDYRKISYGSVTKLYAQKRKLSSKDLIYVNTAEIVILPVDKNKKT